MIACDTIAFHIDKDDCLTVLMLFHCFYPTIWLEYPAIGDDHYLCILYQNIANVSVILMMTEVVKGDR